MSRNKDRAGADAYCKEQKMVLFAIDTNETQIALFKELAALSTASMTYRVDGVQRADWSWYYEGDALAYFGLMWRSTEEPYLDYNTMVVTNKDADIDLYRPTYGIDRVRPSDLLPFICEFTE